jgi:uncharacterized protein (DUF433 family)
MSWADRVAIDPEVPTGKPIVRGPRLSVEFIPELLAACQSGAGIPAGFPGLLRDDMACLAYASR